MTEPPTSRRRWRRWLLILLVCVVAFTAAAGTHFLLDMFVPLYPFGDNGGDGVLAENERLIPVRLDSLLSEISINGSVAFSNKKDMTFGSSGFVNEILVSEGEVVSEGQPLARLDPESVANLSRAIAQANLDHKDVLDALTDAKQPSLQTAEAEAAAANAALELHNAREALSNLLSPKAEDIANSEAALADAELEVQTAQDALDDLLNPKPETLATAEDAAAQARVELRDAELALDNDASAANDNLAIAERDLAVARMNLDALNGSNRLKTARDTHDDKRQDYANVIYKWTGVKATDEDLAMTPTDLFAALNFIPEQVYDRNYPLFTDGRIADNPDTRWNELKVFGWTALYPRSNLIEAECDQYTYSPIRQSNTSSANGEFCIQRDMRNAYDALVSASNDLSSTEAEYDGSLAAAKEALTRAEKAHTDAQETLDRLTEGSIGAAQLQARYDKAQADYNASVRNLDELKNPDAAEVETKRKRLALAQAKRDAAADTLNTLINPYAEEVAARRGQLALAQARLDDANNAFRRLNDRREMQVALQEAAVAAAQAKIDGEKRRYDDSTLKAPWDGYIASIPVEEGEEIEPFKVILTVVNTGIVQIEGSVDEIDVLSLQRDAAASVTLDALPDRELQGIVGSVSSTASNQQGVVTFDVKIDVNIPDDVTLQEGLSAVAKVGISEERGLLIPTQAVQYGDVGAYVRVMSEDEAIVEQPVTLGSSDGFFAIVESGLSEGDRIVMQVLSEGELNPEVTFGPRGRRPPPRDD